MKRKNTEEKNNLKYQNCDDEKGIHSSERLVHLLPTGSKEREVLGVGSIPVAILHSYQYMKMLHHNCIVMIIDG